MLRFPTPGMSHPIKTYLSYFGASTRHLSYLATLDSAIEPRSYHKAIKHLKWVEAMLDEIWTLELNATWTMQDLPIRKYQIGCKWVFRLNTVQMVNGSIKSYKAHLIAVGFIQVKGIDFHESFAPIEVAWLDSSLFFNWLQYVLDILTKVGVLGSRPYPFPMEQQHWLSINSGSKLTNLANYYCSIRCLIYFTITRVELSWYTFYLNSCMILDRETRVWPCKFFGFSSNHQVKAFSYDLIS